MKIDLGKPQVMTIINVTPDSFFAESRTQSVEDIRARVSQAIAEGATIIDVGGYSSRPGAADVELEEEWQRVELGVRVVREVSKEIAISVDTFRSEVVRRVVERFGEIIVNDITAGEGDHDMLSVVAEHGLPYVAMHMRGTPQSMASMAHYRSVVNDVVSYFEERLSTLRSAGIKQIIIDPGFGFAKSLEQNYELLRGLSRLCDMGYPVLAGVSRKSMIYKALGVDPSETLVGTTALNWEALRCGASILRVHDTLAAVQCVKLFEYYNDDDKS